MKKYRIMARNVVITLICTLFLLSSCSSDEYTGEKYKRVELSGLPAEEAYEILKNATVEIKAEADYGDTMPIYRIIQREVTEENFRDFLADKGLDLEQYTVKDGDGFKRYHYLTLSPHCVISTNGENGVNNNFSYSYYAPNTYDTELTATDAEIEAIAFEALQSLPFVQGEYRYSGIGSIQTVSDKESSYEVCKRAVLSRYVDGIKIVYDTVQVYVVESGVESISVSLYDYEKDGELEMMPVETALSKVKRPDAFKIEDEAGKPLLASVDRMVVEDIALRYVNTNEQGGTILQPVYNITGTLYSGEDSVGFSSKIIAIPEKYTYVSDSTEQG